ncbi:hypothetical protein IV498_10080 [Paenarthrobacter sp. Z7-10]|uniref:hypothetical protein n=1 Tax=Paenarthrobacter sp. Z7-10 TaxID=2787635 RepID=UPI0022A98D92|nr:hypothetical protein [Paenarthrobacter sp. Z7-10]MCZ2403519.1 hypothetical protein [Paenarthrobacter sp. Z7-10]
MVDPQQNPQAPGAGAEVWPPSPSATQDPAVDAILGSAHELSAVPTAEHPARYLALHDALRAELDADPLSGAEAGTGHQPAAGPRSGRSE